MFQVADIEGLIGHVVTSSGEAETNPGLAFAAMRLLHSLSRSVQQLRTVFKDHNIWENVFAVREAGSRSALFFYSHKLRWRQTFCEA